MTQKLEYYAKDLTKEMKESRNGHFKFLYTITYDNEIMTAITSRVETLNTLGRVFSDKYLKNSLDTSLFNCCGKPIKEGFRKLTDVEEKLLLNALKGN